MICFYVMVLILHSSYINISFKTILEKMKGFKEKYPVDKRIKSARRYGRNRRGGVQMPETGGSLYTVQWLSRMLSARQGAFPC